MQSSIKRTEIAPRLTHHARKRMAQRNVTDEDLGLVLKYGARVYAAGAVFYYLGATHIPPHRRNDPSLTRLHGATIVLAADHSCVLTVYRNRQNGLRYIKRKASRRFQRIPHEISACSILYS
jgi:hypothetical protein